MLRRFSLDELPQLFNVLAGDMSIVGPRSERPFFVEQFAQFIPGYQQRFKVKAGITGYAQVAGSYDTSPEDKLRYDLLYIKNYSILLDIKLVLETFRAIVTPHLYNRTFHENKTEYAAGALTRSGEEILASASVMDSSNDRVFTRKSGHPTAGASGWLDPTASSASSDASAPSVTVEARNDIGYRIPTEDEKDQV